MKLRKEHKLVVFKTLLDTMLKYFCMVTVAIIIVSWGSTWFSGDTWVLHSQDFILILLIAFLSVFPNIMMSVFVETNSSKGILAVYIIGFVITATLVIGAVIIASPGGGITLGTIARFLLLYAVISIYSFKNSITIELQDKKLAEDINKQLDEIHKGENETHTD